MLVSYSGRAINFGLALSLILFASLIGFVAGAERRWLQRLAVLVAILAALSLEIVIGSATLTGDYRLLALTLVVGSCTSVIGVALSLMERRRTGAMIKRGLPFGVLIIGIGLLGSVSSLIVPVIPSQLAPLEAATVTPVGVTTVAATLLSTRTPRVSATATVPPTLTARSTALPTLTSTPPRAIPPVLIPSVTTTPVQGNPTNSSLNTSVACVITVNRNVNLRAAPNPDSTLLITIPFGSTLPSSGQTTGWWHVHYSDEDGWVTKEATTGSPECTALPAQTP